MTTPSPSTPTPSPTPSSPRSTSWRCTGLLVYEVPNGEKDFSISYLELFDDGTEEGEEGDLFYVYFTAEEQA